MAVLIKQKPCECGLLDGTWMNITNYHSDGQCRKCKKMCINRLTLKLADFNVTRHIGVKRDSCSGSLPWKSPEMENANAHPSMDIWSFGTFFWELLSRKVPNWVSIYIWINKKTKGPPLPLPEDLPPELGRVFDGCWRREISERPSIVQVRAQLEAAEQSVDNNYKWLLREDAQCESSLSVGEGQLDSPTLEDALDSQTNAAVQSSINISAYEVLMLIERFGKKGKKPSKVERMWASWFQPPEARRQKRLAKLDKHSIGAPIDFRHIVSATVRESADDFGDKPMVIRCTANPSRHKSNRSKGNKHQQELSELFNRRVSPPQPHSLSPSTASGGAPIQLRRATFGELDKARRGELGHSTFYVDELDSPPEGSNSTVEELGGGGGRRRSTASNGGIHRSIASYLFKPLIGAKSSPRVDELLEPEAAAVSIGVTFASCFHPHHGTNVAHLCALSSAFLLEFKLGLAPGQLDSKPTEFVRELRPVSVERTPQRHAQHNFQNARFIKRADYPENQARQRHRTESAATAAQLPQRRLHLSSVAVGRSPTSSETGRQRRVSSSLMDTVIELQQVSPSVNDNSRLSSATPRPPGVSILNSTIPMHLNRNGPLIPPQNLSMLSPGRALPNWHQRSRSSDSAAGKPLSANELAELLSVQPVPVDGSIANPSYVPMQENENNAKLLASTTKVTHSATPRQLQAESSKRPVPKPRTAKADDLAQCPTSQAPMLNRAEIAAASDYSQNAFKDFSMPVSEQCRPNTLRLAPSGRHSDATNASAVGESSGCDSGMCASSSNEGENSPLTLVPTKNGSTTLFPSAPNALPTVVSIAESPAQNLRSTNGNAFNRFRPPPPPHFTPPFEVVPPPVPPKQHQKEGGPRVPPLPRNRRVLRQ